MNSTATKDEIRYCERCGISYLWSREEKKSAPGESGLAPEKPHYCPGCRQLLPEAERERGIVKWFNHRKRYGFIVRTDESELFVHRSALKTRSRLRPDDLVEFAIREGERGLVAVNVMIIARDSGSESDSAQMQTPGELGT